MKSLPPVQARIYEAAVRIFAKRGSKDVSVSELAQAAGIARGTIYNNLANPESLFEEVAKSLADEMHARIEESFRSIDDPAYRLAFGMRFFVRRAHEEPHWGHFIVRFGFTTTVLRAMLSGPPTQGLRDGMASGRYSFRPEQLSSVAAFLGAATVAAMCLVLDGDKTWREAGSDAAEMMLRSIGLTRDEAASIASEKIFS